MLIEFEGTISLDLPQGYVDALPATYLHDEYSGCVTLAAYSIGKRWTGSRESAVDMTSEAEVQAAEATAKDRRENRERDHSATDDAPWHEQECVA